MNGGRNWKVALLRTRGRCGGTAIVMTAALLEIPFRVVVGGQLA